MFYASERERRGPAQSVLRLLAPPITAPPLVAYISLRYDPLLLMGEKGTDAHTRTRAWLCAFVHRKPGSRAAKMAHGASSAPVVFFF